MNLLNKRILSIFAHREDGFLFGWPVLQNKRISRFLYIIVKEAIEIVNRICKNENINFLGYTDYNNKFSFQLNCRQKKVYEKILKKLKSVIIENRFDYIFTHNPMGEYGHSDHKFLFELIYNNFDIPIIITDILVESSHCVYYKKIPKNCSQFYKTKICEVAPDINFYKRNRNIFINSNMWSKNRHLSLSQYPNIVSLYLVK